MDLLGSQIEDPLDNVLELGPPHDGVLTEEDPVAVDHVLDGNQLHPGHQVPDPLVLRHEAPGPGLGVLHKGPSVRDAGSIGVPDSVPGARVRDTGYQVHLDVIPVP